MDDYLSLGIFVFIVILSVIKYKCINTLKESIMDFLSQIIPAEKQKTDDVIALEELTDEIATLILSNKELFFRGD